MKRIPSALGLAVASMTLVALACGSSGTTGGSGGSGGGNTGAGGNNGAGGATSNADAGTSCPARPNLIATSPTCDNVVNSATAIPFTALSGTAPTPSGGAILDGLYESTKTGSYGSTSGGGRRIAFVITTLADSSRHMLWNGEVLDMTGANVTTSFKADVTITVTGTQIVNTTINCGATAPLPAAFDYTVAGSDLILSLANAATNYTRRGCAP